MGVVTERRYRWLGRVLVTLAAVAAMVGPAVAAPAPHRYRIVDLGVGYEFDSRTLGFGPGGLIVGWVTEDAATRAAVWQVPGTEPARLVGPPFLSPFLIGPRGEVVGIVPGEDGTSSIVRSWRGEDTVLSEGMFERLVIPVAIDSRGRVLITAYDGESGFQARLTDGRRVRELTGFPEPVPPDPTDPTGRWFVPSLFDMNDRGQIVGAFSRPGATETVFVWEDGQVTYLPSLPDPGPDPVPARPVAIDERGVVVGISRTDGGASTHPVLWKDGRVVDLGLPAGARSCDVQGYSARFETGYVVGNCTTAVPDELRGYVWHRGTFTDLGNLGRPWTTASVVNERGQVAGTSASASAAQHAYVWDRGVMTDLGTLGGTISDVTDIDERGRVTGNAERADGRTHAVLWLPSR